MAEKETFSQALTNWGGWVRSLVAALIAVLTVTVGWAWNVATYKEHVDNALTSMSKQLSDLDAKLVLQVAQLDRSLADRLTSTNDAIGRVAASLQTAVTQINQQGNDLALQKQKNEFQDKQIDALTVAAQKNLEAIVRLRELQPMNDGRNDIGPNR